MVKNKLNANSLRILYEILLKNDFLKLKDFIFENGLDAVDSDGNNVFLHCITDDNFITLVEKLIDEIEALDINFQNKSGTSALHFAVKFKKIKLLGLLLKNKRVNVNIQDINGDTPLSLALFQFNEDNEENIIIKLLEAGADVNIIDKYGYKLNKYIHKSMEKVNKYIKEHNIEIFK